MDKPIIFSTEMVKAILAGRKSQTRRVIKPQPPHATFHRRMGEFGCDIEVADGYYMNPPIKPDDTLWVRETWGHIAHQNVRHGGYDEWLVYRATPPKGEFPDDFKWKPSIYMPREASRISLLVKGVQVERIQDITEEDAEKEGVRGYGPNNCSGVSARIAFAELWDSINEKRGFGWATNPWVWVIEFEVKQP